MFLSLTALRRALVRGVLGVLRFLQRADLSDVFLLVGIGLLFFGLWQIWKPLPYVVIGSLLVWLAVSPPAGAPPVRPEIR